MTTTSNCLFAIWFFLGLEGVANVAEETIRPQRNVLIGFGSALATLIVLCVLVFVSSIGVAGWEAIVYPVAGKPETSNSPLPLALSKITGSGGAMYHLLITIGLMGLVASFHGIILAASRATFEFGRVKYIPAAFGKVSPRTRTPVNALVINMCIGIIALLTGRTDEIITISCFGALTLFILAMVTLLVLRKREPELERPFRIPLYPLPPLLAMAGFVLILIKRSEAIGGLAVEVGIGITGSIIYFVRARRLGQWPFQRADNSR